LAALEVDIHRGRSLGAGALANERSARITLHPRAATILREA
jgi:hypothetical protein